MNFRNYIVGTIFIIFLIWGPIDHEWPAWLFIRIGYLILIPVGVWFIVKWVWSTWLPTQDEENVIDKLFAGLISLGLWTLAVLKATSKTHIGNTKWIQTRDGMEAVGDDIVLKGPDLGIAIMIGIAAFCILWFGVIQKKSANTES